MSDEPDLTPEAVSQLIIDDDGDACINDGREFDLVALPARHDNGDILNPFEWDEMVRRFNDWPALSAAPDMLDALRECRDWIKRYHFYDRPDLVQKADAAIAKAEGKQ